MEIAAVACEAATAEQLAATRHVRVTSLKSIVAETVEMQHTVATAEIAESILTRVEDVLRSLQTVAAPAPAPVTAAIPVLRTAFTDLDKVISLTIITGKYGFEQAARMRAPMPIDLGSLSAEEQRVLREIQKDAETKVKHAAPKARQAPYAAPNMGTGASFRSNNTTCHSCGQVGHWSRDNKCRVTDIQAKALRDATAKLQLTALPSMHTGAPYQGGGYQGMTYQQAALQPAGYYPFQPPAAPPQFQPTSHMPYYQWAAQPQSQYIAQGQQQYSGQQLQPAAQAGQQNAGGPVGQLQLQYHPPQGN